MPFVHSYVFHSLTPFTHTFFSLTNRTNDNVTYTTGTLSGNGGGGVGTGGTPTSTSTSSGFKPLPRRPSTDQLSRSLHSVGLAIATGDSQKLT